MLKRQKLFMALLSVLSLGYFSNFLAWGDYATEPDHETSGTVDAAERNTAREEAERAEHERVADWGKKSLKDKLSSISLFRNRNTYSDAAADRNTVSLGEALKFTFGKKDAADKSIVDHKKTSAAQETRDMQFTRKVEGFKQENQALERAKIDKQKSEEKILEKEKQVFLESMKKYSDIIAKSKSGNPQIDREMQNLVDIATQSYQQLSDEFKTEFKKTGNLELYKTKLRIAEGHLLDLFSEEMNKITQKK
jgi:hypothetical protein